MHGIFEPRMHDLACKYFECYYVSWKLKHLAKNWDLWMFLPRPLLRDWSLALKLSSAGCPRWKAQTLVFRDAQVFVIASTDAKGFVDVAPIRKYLRFSIHLDQSLCLCLHGCKARVACTFLPRCRVLNLGISTRLVWVHVKGASNVLLIAQSKPGASLSPSAVYHYLRYSWRAEELAESGSAQSTRWAAGWFCVSRVAAFFR